MLKATLFSVSYAGYWGQHALDLPGFLEKAARLGYDAVELTAKRPHLSVLDFSGETSLLALRERADHWGLEIATIAGYTDFTAGRQAAEVPLIEMQVQYIRELSRMARVLGASIVRVFSGYTSDLQDYPSDWNKCVRGLREAAAVAADYGVLLGLQNHHDIGAGVEAFAELLSDVAHPNLRAMFDPWSVALQGADLYQAARRMAPHMVQTTLADYVRLPRYRYVPTLINYEHQLPAAVKAVPLGHGFLDLEAFFAGLKEGGFRDGYVAYEICSPLRGGGSEANLDAASRESLEVIRRLMSA